ncbi:hypothetical protein Tco_0892732 [Tanacetum coccineum]|uniref:Uncharacterized protein n=1 Tax=Tanacetum coccineum TaxID=301880 RepID=A0ABQ5C6R2_9ASTR
MYKKRGAGGSGDGGDVADDGMVMRVVVLMAAVGGAARWMGRGYNGGVVEMKVGQRCSSGGRWRDRGGGGGVEATSVKLMLMVVWRLWPEFGRSKGRRRKRWRRVVLVEGGGLLLSGWGGLMSVVWIDSVGGVCEVVFGRTMVEVKSVDWSMIGVVGVVEDVVEVEGVGVFGWRCFMRGNMKREDIFKEGNMSAGAGVQRFCWKSVNEISGSMNTVTPKMNWKIGLKSKSSGHFKELFMFSFHPCILLGCIGT